MSKLAVPIDPDLAAATSPARIVLGRLASVLDELAQVDWCPGDSVEAAAMMAELDSVTRRSVAASIDLLGAVEQSRLHYADGHPSARH